ncbi:PREDICTED: polygalacturonase inhibitor-like [Nelumbo nucifera]|uniref:Leucine-rich repeat-containing N-terminal plant-type domain-containing protein n=2 Tax=Nelumbo nucifera TaxID=4432 RepID=A0A822YAH4_NELNU|nr:PREDICTED: polygalacturonase inhibitor-like [Nelumbo nucifera]DAD29103.1 TPA_asm: hypothetical protein HUJ06_030571 [Nelumbo nucifera]
MNSHGSFSSSFILLFLLVSSSLPSPALSDSTPRCNPADNGALLRIKESLNIPDYFADWNSSKECCDWSHLGCGAYSGEVAVLVFDSINSPFKIPAAIGDLSHLLALAFYDIPNLTGSIPSSFTKLQNLVSITIRNTTLSGPIPEFLSQLKNLRELELPYNQLSGSIPPSLVNLNELKLLSLGWNRLTGYIPDSFGGFNADVLGGFSMLLSHNQLSGEIPSSLGQFNVSRIDLSYNNLVGDASILFRENATATSINLSNNQLDFDLSSVRFPRSLKSLDLSHNMIRGRIPKQITKLNLQSMDLSYNRLCGRIPVGGKVQKFGAKSFAYNLCLCGAPLPKCK